jgi:hypothetical protein
MREMLLRNASLSPEYVVSYDEGNMLLRNVKFSPNNTAFITLHSEDESNMLPRYARLSRNCTVL